jgi:bidirectional [NiFe] hydrogenase diaphorase subunit
MAVRTLSIDGKQATAEEDETILDAAAGAGIKIPTLCHLEGLTNVGACRMCLTEVAGSSKLLPACVTKVAEGMEVQTNTERLRKYRLMILELLFAERNHICAVCVANNHCDLQNLATDQGMMHVRFPYLYPNATVDASH